MITAPVRPSPKRDPLLLALVGVPAVGAVTTLVVQLHLSTWGGASIDAEWLLLNLLFGGWALLPFAAAVAVGGRAVTSRSADHERAPLERWW